MKRIFPASPAFLLCAGIVLLQTIPAHAATKITPGTIVPAELTKGLDAKKIKVSDKIEARTSVDLISDGQIIIPKGSKITGHISDVKAPSKGSKDSLVGIAFDQLSTKDGDLAIQATIQAIGRPAESEPSSSSMAGGPIGSAGASLPSGGSGRSSGSSGSSLSPNSQGVVGIRGLSLSTSGAASVISGSKENVHLESGTQLILRIQ
jgi:hypothetical protein